MRKTLQNDEIKWVKWGILVYFLLIISIALNTNGTCDPGDSIYHYLFARYAFIHPENFLNHWAKPFFVLLSAPFAQLGFVGIKLFNCVVASLTAWFVYKIARKCSYSNAWLAPLFLMFAPGYFIHLFSGLTEPLFGLILILGIFMVVYKHEFLGAVFISFLPFVRSEGLVVIVVFLVYFVVNKQFVSALMLLVGHFVYSIIGSIYYNDLFWVFTKIPYAGSSGKYGHGDLMHFLVQLNYIIGIPMYVLLSAGLVVKIIEVFKQGGAWLNFIGAEMMLLFGVFIAFIAAHTIFWYFGIFESMGLKRVLVAIVPLGAIIALKGFNGFLALFEEKVLVKRWGMVFSIAMVVAFPFTSNPAAVNWNKDLSLTADEQLVKQATVYIQSAYPKDIYMYYSHPYFNITMNKDPFDKTGGANLEALKMEDNKRPYLAVWDSRFSSLENGVQLEELKGNPQLKVVKYFKHNNSNETASLVLFSSCNN